MESKLEDISNKYSTEEERDIFAIYSQTCATMFHGISKKQIEYMQAAMKLQESVLDSCNGMVKNQLDFLGEFL
jgi:hypothetical protein